MHTDPIADMLTRIRNANQALHPDAIMPSSKLKEQIAKILAEEGFVDGYRVDEARGRIAEHAYLEDRVAEERHEARLGLVGGQVTVHLATDLFS